MKKIAFPLILFLSIFLMSGSLLAMSSEPERGTIRGAVYLDVDGDGRCLSSNNTAGVPVANIDLTFVALASDESAVLYSGSNGTYGLPTAGQGIWQVTAVPNPALWRVTSANPLSVNVSEETGLVQLNVNFCVQPAPGVSLPTARLETLPQKDATALLQSATQTAVSPAAQTSNAAVSEMLLTNPPAPEPAPDLDIAATTEVDSMPAETWLVYLNHFRTMGGLAPLQNSAALSNGSQLHSRYMVLNDKPIAHSETSTNPLYTPEGHNAAQNGNIFATTQIEADYTWAMNFWASAPFHLVPILDPALETVGYGNFNAPNGTFRMAAVLDVHSERGNAQNNSEYPLYFPAPNSTTWIVRHSLFEWPDPLASCAGYQRPTGSPIVLQLGDGSLTPRVTSYAFSENGRVVPSCLLTETTYSNPDSFAQKTGRTILDEQDAIVLMPRSPLLANSTYTVTIVANGETYTWSFQTGNAPGSE